MDDLVAQFSAVTGAPSRQAQQFLSAHNGDLETAIQNYYAAQEDHTEDPADDPTYTDDELDSTGAGQPQSSTSRGGGRRLGDGPLNPSAASDVPVASQPKPKANSQKKFATLGDYGAGARPDDESDDDEKQDFFAGGEKSGLAVQNPDDLKKRILEKAQKHGPPAKDEPKKKSHFHGSARTLGGDDTPSREIPADPRAAEPPQRVERILHFWRDGFSVDDGDLYRNDDPRNAELLQLIQQGRAPLRIMNVQPGQEVDVEIKQHDENYVKPKKKYKPFEGQGNRLGSPTPGVQSMPGAFETTAPSHSTSQPTSAQPTSQVDESQPTITLRVNLGTGTRLTSRFNTTQTVGDVYDFVRRAEAGGREFVLQTTFPTMELKDTTQVLGEMPEFKRGGAVVQRYI